jgi:putative IMPACT (imprinted ancient) family translation regulator
VLIIVVRYFGGTLLGVPGLIHAYKTAAALALQVTPVVRKPVEVNYTLQFDYTIMNDVMTIVKQCDCIVLNQEMQLFCRMQVAVPKNRLEEVLYKLKTFHSLELNKI